jgi:hypothetical protein
MGSLRIEQYAGQGLDGRSTLPMPQLPLVAAAEVLTTSGTSAPSVTLDKKTRALFMRNEGATNIAVRLGASVPTDPVALATDASIAAGEARWFSIDPAVAGQDLKLAAIDY